MKKGKVFKTTVYKYSDDFEVILDTIELEIKSNEPIYKESVERGISKMFDLGCIGYDVEIIE